MSATTRPFARSRPSLAGLERRDTPAVAAGTVAFVGTDAGAPPVVRGIDVSTGDASNEFLAFDPDFLGGVRVATGDVTGDGTPTW